MNEHPRTSHGPRCPEHLCEGTARQMFGVTEEELERRAAELDGDGDGDEDAAEDVLD